MLDTKTYKCPKCGTELTFDSVNQIFRCQNCNAKFALNTKKKEQRTEQTSNVREDNQNNIENIINTIPQSKKIIDTTEQNENIQENQKQVDTNSLNKTDITQPNNKELYANSNIFVYTCSDCNSEIITTTNNKISSCIFCNNKNISKNELQKKLPNTKIIPFKIDKKSAIKKYKEFGKNRPFKPSAFKNANQISGVYVPFYLYNCDSNGLIELNCKKNTSWKTGNYKYKKTDTYLVTRDGNMSLENIPIDTTKKFTDIIDFIGPFNPNELESFNESYLNNYSLISPKMTSEEILKESVGKAKIQFIEEMKKSTEGYEEIEPIKNAINLYNSKMTPVLLPIWFLNIDYKKKNYSFVINGQTGKITGYIPPNTKKFINTWIMLFITVFLISFLICLVGVIL